MPAATGGRVDGEPRRGRRRVVAGAAPPDPIVARLAGARAGDRRRQAVGLMASHVAVAAVGRDRPGIVAAVTGVLVEEGCNLEDTSMSILRGHFAMMLVVASPPELAPADLEHKLARATSDLDLVVSVRPIGDDVPHAAEGDRWTVVVYGADRPGIVHRIATELADIGVNIEDLTTRVAGDDERPVYTMVLEVVVPEGVDASAVAGRVDAAARELGVEASLHPSEADIL